MVAIRVCANVLLHALSPKSSICLIPEPVSFSEVCSTVLATDSTTLILKLHPTGNNSLLFSSSLKLLVLGFS